MAEMGFLQSAPPFQRQYLCGALPASACRQRPVAEEQEQLDRGGAPSCGRVVLLEAQALPGHADQQGSGLAGLLSPPALGLALSL